MATIAQRIRSNLTGLERQARPAVVFSAETVNSATFDVNLSSVETPKLSVGDILETDDGAQLYITAISSPNVVFIVWAGTYTGITSGDTILVNPRITKLMIDDAIAATKADLQNKGIFTIADTTLTLVAGQTTYGLNLTDVDPKKGVLSAQYKEASDSSLVGIPFFNVPDYAELSTELWAVSLPTWGNLAAGDTVTLVYAQKLTSGGELTEPYAELITMGATARLYDALEGPRIHDPGRFTDRTVQPGQPLRDGNVWWGRYQRQTWVVRATLNAEIARLPGYRWRRSQRYLGAVGGSGLTRGTM